VENVVENPKKEARKGDFTRALSVLHKISAKFLNLAFAIFRYYISINKMLKPVMFDILL
jgi:hypothetical protein